MAISRLIVGKFKVDITISLRSAANRLQDTTCPHVTMFRMMRGASSSPERKDMVISRRTAHHPEHRDVWESGVLKSVSSRLSIELSLGFGSKTKSGHKGYKSNW